MDSRHTFISGNIRRHTTRRMETRKNETRKLLAAIHVDRYETARKRWCGIHDRGSLTIFKILDIGEWSEHMARIFNGNTGIVFSENHPMIEHEGS